MIDKQIELLKIQIEKLDNPKLDIKAWKSSTILILDRIFGSDFTGIKSIENIKYTSGGVSMGSSSSYWNNIESCKRQGKEILESCITDLSTFGERQKPEANSPGININLTQNQTISITILKSALEDELTVTQMKEIREIVEGHENKSTKKKKIIEKLTNAGIDTAAKIVSNILTNPNLWG